MIRSNESAIQRLQVGLVGLLSVLVFVSIASMILTRADGTAQSAATQEAAKSAGQDANAKPSGDDPLVELGVTPVVPEQQGKQAPAGPATQKPQN
jgi:hypothetical protein